MNYTYKIRRTEPKQGFLAVIYSTTDQPDIYKNFSTQDFSAAGITSLIEGYAERVVAQWEAMAAAGETSELAEGTEGSGVAYPKATATAPVYDPDTETLEESWAVVSGVNQQSWTVVPRSGAEVIEIKLGRIAAARYAKEGVGVVWTDDAGDNWYLDTTADSQARFAAARLAVESGDRQSGAVWKCAKLENGVPALAFRPTTNAEVVVWAGLVHSHVQKCFEAEAVATDKLLAGDLTADFETEFDAL